MDYQRYKQYVVKWKRLGSIQMKFESMVIINHFYDEGLFMDQRVNLL